MHIRFAQRPSRLQHTLLYGGSSLAVAAIVAVWLGFSQGTFAEMTSVFAKGVDDTKDQIQHTVPAILDRDPVPPTDSVNTTTKTSPTKNAGLPIDAKQQIINAIIQEIQTKK